MRKTWTVADIPDLTGKVAIVTGANSGVGWESARALAQANATVILACRSVRRGDTAANAIRQEAPTAQVIVRRLDLADLESIRTFARVFMSERERLDILVNNAGVMLAPYGTTKDGFELHMGTNHLGHFALTGILLERLLRTAGSRIVNVSSLAHRVGRMDFSNLMYTNGKNYSAFGAYARSKLANLLFTAELQRQLQGTETIAVAAHPGGAVTNLGRHMGDRCLYRMLQPLFEHLSQSAAQGALPILRAVADPSATGGEYYGPSGRFQIRGAPVVVKAHPRARDQDVAQELWRVSEELTGVSPDSP